MDNVGAASSPSSRFSPVHKVLPVCIVCVLVLTARVLPEKSEPKAGNPPYPIGKASVVV
jgi:hypothetical protein